MTQILTYFKPKKMDTPTPKKTPTPLSGLLPRLGLLAILASGHLTEPIWLGLFIVALPDLATPIAKSFGNAFWNN